MSLTLLFKNKEDALSEIERQFEEVYGSSLHSKCLALNSAEMMSQPQELFGKISPRNLANDVALLFSKEEEKENIFKFETLI